MEKLVQSCYLDGINDNINNDYTSSGDEEEDRVEYSSSSSGSSEDGDDGDEEASFSSAATDVSAASDGSVEDNDTFAQESAAEQGSNDSPERSIGMEIEVRTVGSSASVGSASKRTNSNRDDDDGEDSYYCCSDDESDNGSDGDEDDGGSSHGGKEKGGAAAMVPTISSVMNKRRSRRGGNSSTNDDKTENLVQAVLRQTHDCRWRLLALSSMVLLGILAAVGAYEFLAKRHTSLTTSAQRRSTEYELYAHTLKESMESQMEAAFRAYASLGDKVTASVQKGMMAKNDNDAEDENLFPWSVLPSWRLFQVYARHAREQSGTPACTFAPAIKQSQRLDWETFSVERYDKERSHMGSSITPYIFKPGGEPADLGAPYYYPLWFRSASDEKADANLVNLDLGSFFSRETNNSYHEMVQTAENLQASVLSRVMNTSDWVLPRVLEPQDVAQNQDRSLDAAQQYQDRPSRYYTVLVQPVFDRIVSIKSDEKTEEHHLPDDDSQAATQLVGVLQAVLPWDSVLQQGAEQLEQIQAFSEAGNGISFVVENSCGQVFSYELEGNKVVFRGQGDLHEPEFSQMEVAVQFSDSSASSQVERRSARVLSSDLHTAGPSFSACGYAIRIYPSTRFFRQQSALPSDTKVSAGAVAATLFSLSFILLIASFLVYDMYVRRRTRKIAGVAEQSNQLVSSLFPSNVRDRLFAQDDDQALVSGEAKKKKRRNGKKQAKQSPHAHLKSFLHDKQALEDTSTHDEVDVALQSKPIADLFPETTVLFGDLAGFTAWSSVREPCQVFELLETLYRAFDEIAKRRHVFKVETIGDCYVAVTGLPEPRKDHAILMCRFARECVRKMRTLCKNLEVTLGPDTSDLMLRVGIHSGPVTGGVLRGDRCRFQLFGDTMNKAARIESAGMGDRIQISAVTANILIASGKKQWVKPREEAVIDKESGQQIQTFWLRGVGSIDGADSLSYATSDAGDSISDGRSDADWDDDVRPGEEKLLKSLKLPERQNRLIRWTADVLLRLLKQVVARRSASTDDPEEAPPTPQQQRRQMLNTTSHGERTVMDEVQEIIALPAFDAKAVMHQENPALMVVSHDIESQLRDFVTNIAIMYRDNPFHCFEHASHVTMSVVKLLSRIVAPSSALDQDEKDAAHLHDNTYGITSDPLTQFACVFSALIHDVDHSGVPNSQLVKENSKLAKHYKGKSVAEQNSVDLAWDLLMDESYPDLRRAIFSTDAEKRRFRSLVVNSVMSTDIIDPEMKQLRNSRWERAFKISSDSSRKDSVENVNRKATIVIEHLIQASDVAHTMQHWHVYRKWNERLFEEMYLAYKNGRADKDPADNWYQGEIGFFDFYIIPLARKLKECGVFGVSSDEYLNYCVQNRKEWEERGREVVAEMVEKVRPMKRPSGNGADEKSSIPAPPQPNIFDIVAKLTEKANAVDRELTCMTSLSLKGSSHESKGEKAGGARASKISFNPVVNQVQFKSPETPHAVKVARMPQIARVLSKRSLLEEALESSSDASASDASPASNSASDYSSGSSYDSSEGSFESGDDSSSCMSFTIEGSESDDFDIDPDDRGLMAAKNSLGSSLLGVTVSHGSLPDDDDDED